MRGTSLMAAILLMSCGSPAPENESLNAADSGAQGVGEANSATPAQPTDAVDGNAAVEADAVSACLMQGEDRLQVEPIRAIGTEPFWGVRVEGRCVTYSTPEDQKGTRVWTRYSAGPNGGGSWVGQLGGKPFEMRTKPEPGCSDGMSDKVYPTAVELTVNGEQRRGCAEPL